MKALFIRNICFVVIGVLALIRSLVLQSNTYAMAPDYFIDELQFLSLILLAIGGSGIYQYFKEEKK